MTTLYSCIKDQHSTLSNWQYYLASAGQITQSHTYGPVYSDQGNLYPLIATDSGLYKGSGYGYIPLGYHINAMRESANGLSGIWMATTQGLKVYYDYGSPPIMDAPINGAGPTSTMMYDVLVNDSDVWVTTAAGISVYHTGPATWSNIPMANVHNISMDLNHDVWVTSETGLNKYNGTTWTNYGTAQGLPANAYKRIFGSADGYLYIQISDAEGGGFIRYAQGNCTRYGVADGLLSDSLAGWTQDNQWKTWICTSKGISTFDGSHFTSIPLGLSNNRGLPAGNQPTDIAISEGTKIVSTTGGLITFQ